MQPGSRLWPWLRADEDSSFAIERDALVPFPPVQVSQLPFWRPREITAHPAILAEDGIHAGRQLFGTGHVESLSAVNEPPVVHPDFRQGLTIDLGRLEVSLHILAPYTPTFDGDVFTVGIFWDRNAPVAPVSPVSRYWEIIGAVQIASRPEKSLAEVELLWAKDYVMEEPRYDVIANPVRPNQTTQWFERIALDLTGLRAKFQTNFLGLGLTAGGNVVLTTFCAKGGLPVASLQVSAEWRLFFSNSKEL